MRELREILDRVDALALDERAILATVVDVKGSGYRLAGARMLIDEDGNSIGSVSGGCLESDVLERAKSVLRTGRPALVEYDSTTSENSVFGLQMGCRGIVRILLEPADDRALFDFIQRSFQSRRASAIATAISQERLGQRFYFRDERLETDDYSNPVSDIIGQLARDVGEAISERRSRSAVYPTCEGELELFIEVIEPRPSILIFGAGHDAIPLAAFAKQLGWLVTVVDRRPAYANPERFPGADSVIAAHADQFDESLLHEENAFAVLMTHHADSDREILRRLINSQCRYVGILGPKQRTADLLKQITDSGTEIDRAFLDRLHAPVGLDIGATTPESIALSIVAEIQAVIGDRAGGHLKYRTKPIYDR